MTEMTKPNHMILVKEAPYLERDMVGHRGPYQSKYISFDERESDTNQKLCHGTSHIALIPVLFLAQIFAVMPLYGFKSSEASTLKFVWMCGRMLHSVVILFAVTAMAILSIIWGTGGTISIRRLEPIIWFVSKFIIMINFTYLARSWPQLMKHWESVEQKLPAYDDEKRNWDIHSKIKWMALSLTIVIFVEHSMSIAAGVYRGSLCQNRTAIQGYFNQAYPQVYHLVPFSSGGLVEFLVEFVNYYCTFLWSFIDMFIVAISICLTTRFNQFNEYLMQFKGKPMPQTFWIKQRQSFTMLTDLVIRVDESISVLTTFSLSNNLYYILIQLLHTFTPKETSIENFYFWFSLVFLLGRTLYVALTAARLNEESKRPIDILRSVPTEHYHMETKRFLEQLTNSEVTLTGMRFFYLNRRLVLSMAGTVATYELVLIQFQTLLVGGAQAEYC